MPSKRSFRKPEKEQGQEEEEEEEEEQEVKVEEEEEEEEEEVVEEEEEEEEEQQAAADLEKELRPLGGSARSTSGSFGTSEMPMRKAGLAPA